MQLINQTTRNGVQFFICTSSVLLYFFLLLTSSAFAAEFTNKTGADGLAGITLTGVYASGTTVYAATHYGLSISTDDGNSLY